MTSFRVLIDEHDELAALSRKLLATLNRGCASAPQAFQIRETLSTKLSDHLDFEDAGIYPQLMACGDRATSTIANEFCESFQLLARDWAIYLSRWQPDTAAANWAEFSQATRTIIARLLRRIADENALLYPAALRATVIALR